MGLRLSKYTIVVLAALNSVSLHSQEQDGEPKDADYKDPKQFERFYKRRNTIAAWQINQLKTGALVVRLRTNNLLISELQKEDPDFAEKKRLEMAATNINIMRSFIYNYDFSKVYFIYSSSSDTLLNGARSNIFLDTSLSVNPSITMNEKFYLLAEPGKVYNSSIGFVPEDSASMVTERGNATTADFPVVLKNKYGHQLKKPFPYVTSRKPVLGKKAHVVNVMINGESIPFNVGDLLAPGEKEITYRSGDRIFSLNLPRTFTYEVYSIYVSQLNENLIAFFQRNPAPNERSLQFREAKPFLY